MNFLIQVCLMIYFCNGSLSAPRKPRLSLAENYSPTYYIQNIDGISGTYSFGYDIGDTKTGNFQFRAEERYPNSSVIGNYGYVDASGSLRKFQYIADKNGYRIFEIKPSNTNTDQMKAKPFQLSDLTTESSITWTRPKKTKKERPTKPLLDKMSIHKRPQEFNLIGPPSLYVEH